MSESPGAGSGMVALLFTDVIGSTKMLQLLGDDAADLRRAHFASLSRAWTSRSRPSPWSGT